MKKDIVTRIILYVPLWIDTFMGYFIHNLANLCREAYKAFVVACSVELGEGEVVIVKIYTSIDLSKLCSSTGFERMVRVSVLNDALKSMYNAEKRGKRQVKIRPSSKVIIKFLLVMQKHGYIGEFEYVDDHRAGKIVVELNGRLNKCGVISPRFDVGVKDIEPWTARLLPSRQFGYIVLTTSAGIMDHEEARRKNVGGKVLGFFY
ncbi:hypothetical protein HPP92_000924 [Vanilla planifolia]|uniref:Small ribosomal subunit protein uS8c n=6 Tax=Orchidaceae TaxID=4747 RepID=A0A835SC20_VANPL|nr:hypothetical protein HPP92_000924 [Vanilla planifolia]